MSKPLSIPVAALRTAGPEALAAALAAARRDTLARLADWQAAGRLVLPYADTVNPPCWEAGHVGWFAAHWTTRNPAWRQGARADPAAAGAAADDALYDSSRVPHAARWQLPLPPVDALREQLAAQLEATLALLRQAGDDDDALYFFRLALAHEDMHHEAAVYMARAHGVPVSDAAWQPRPEAGPRTELAFDSARFSLGHAGPGFAFDNELGAHTVDVPAFRIDRRAVTWAEFQPFVEAGGYADASGWTEAGRRWLQDHGPRVPGAPDEAACGLCLHEAEAWCAWAGRRLPTEAEWERAAIERPGDFAWGSVWEWTASPFLPYPGFVPHPYRDYSAPWFDGRPVLRGASWATQPRLHHPRYRNFFTAGRTDVIAGFRSCAR